MRGAAKWASVMAAGLCLGGCRAAPEVAPVAGGDGVKIEVTSTAFENEGDIPAKYTCNGDNVSPPLAWSPGPPGTRAYALIMDDPDAPVGTWVHWVAWNIAGTALAEAVEADDAATPQGTNSGKKVGYAGPCPPRPTGTHRYYFKVYALDAPLALPSTTTKDGLLKAMESHVLAQGELMGRYKQP
jgi:Raf kinase inhibitor-like YbhB/YbcL family protein